MAERVTVIYVSYRSGREILRSLESLRASGTRRELEIIVVDNASDDDSVELLSAQADLKLIANRANLGYAKAVNLGLKAATGDLFLVLNPDVTVEPGSVDALADFLGANPKAGLVGAKLLNEDGSLQHSCRSFYTFWTILLRRTPLGKIFRNSRALRHHLMLDYDHETPARVDWILGACMMGSRRALDEVGGMDERYFLYFEDVDWCYRMHQRGWEVWYLPTALMNHVHKRASARNPFSRSLLAHIGSFIHYFEKWNPASYLFKRYRNPLKLLGLLLLDAAGLSLALLGALWLRLTGAAGLFEHSYFDAEPYWRFAPFYLGVSLALFFLMGLYRVDRRTPLSEQLIALLKAEVMAPVVLLAANFLTGEDLVSRAVILFAAPLSVLAVLLLRGLLRALHRRFLRLNFDLRRLLLVGSAEEAAEMEALFLARPELGLDLVGRVDPSGDGAGSLGGLERLESIAREERVQEVLVAPSAAHLDTVSSVLSWSRARNVDLRVLSELAGVMTARTRAEDFLGRAALAYRMGGGHAVLLAFKRLADLVFATLLFLISLVPGLLLALGRRLRGRPARRMLELRGRRGRKLRMPLALWGEGTASDLANPCLYLRVIAGGMSLVGPRPLAAGEPGPDPAMRPGLTGHWRLPQGGESRLSQDRLYAHNWGPGLDLRLWIETLGAQFRGDFPPAIHGKGTP